MTVVCMLFLSFIIASTPPVDVRTQSAAKLEGRWKLVELLDPSGAENDISGLVGSLFFEFNDDDITMRTADFEGWTWKFSIDATKSPKWMDWDEGRRTWEGIYKIEGDELTICVVGWKNPPRPTEFRADADGPYVLMIFKRITP